MEIKMDSRNRAARHRRGGRPGRRVPPRADHRARSAPHGAPHSDARVAGAGVQLPGGRRWQSRAGGYELNAIVVIAGAIDGAAGLGGIAPAAQRSESFSKTRLPSARAASASGRARPIASS